MADSTTVDTGGWSILMPAEKEVGANANRFDQWRESDQKGGPQPESHEVGGPPETNPSSGATG